MDLLVDTISDDASYLEQKKRAGKFFSILLIAEVISFSVIIISLFVMGVIYLQIILLALFVFVYSIRGCVLCIRTMLDPKSYDISILTKYLSGRRNKSFRNYYSREPIRNATPINNQTNTTSMNTCFMDDYCIVDRGYLISAVKPTIRVKVSDIKSICFCEVNAKTNCMKVVTDSFESLYLVGDYTNYPNTLFMELRSINSSIEFSDSVKNE